MPITGLATRHVTLMVQPAQEGMSTFTIPMIGRLPMHGCSFKTQNRFLISTIHLFRLTFTTRTPARLNYFSLAIRTKYSTRSFNSAVMHLACSQMSEGHSLLRGKLIYQAFGLLTR